MKPAIIITIIIGIMLTILFFLLAVFISLYHSEIRNEFDAWINNMQIIDRNRRRAIRARRNAIYIYPSPPIREIELTPLPKKNFIVIENPNSPYTLGIECLSE